MIEIDKYEQQIILACKSWGEWAKREDRYKAVKVVISQYYAIPEDKLRLYAMYDCLLELFMKIKQNSIYAFQCFMRELFKDSITAEYKREIDMEHIIKNLISAISESSVKDSDGNDIFKELELNYDILNKGIDMV